MKIVKIDRNSELYSYKLKQISNAPKQLYCCGDIELLNQQTVAIVGSRKFTVYGKNVAKMIGHRMAELGICVTSGLAYGIDGFAHEGMLEAGGRGIAVLGSGILKMTPQKNHQLMLNLVDKGGLVISEYAPDEAAFKGSFPARNRIISGLSDAVVVVEANYNSGALITAQNALEQGRMVFAVPGNINSQFSMGSNLLIRDGANPLIVIDDIPDFLGIDVNREKEVRANLGEDELKILKVVEKFNGIGVDKISNELKMRPELVNSIITIMEIKGIVETYSGKIHLAK